MAKQIIVTQNDYGIELETQFVDNKKKPLDITGYDVKVKIIYDDKTIDTISAGHKDSVNGIAYIVLEKEHLINAGLHTSVWSVVDEDEHVTAQENVYYFVKDVEGSEDDEPNIGSSIDTDGVLDKFNEIDNNLFELTEQGNVVNEKIDSINETLSGISEQMDKKAPKDLATPTKEGLMAKEDKIKLNGIDENANNYEHPLTHSASIIEQDTTHRFVTDDNIAKWNGVKSLGVSGYYKLAGGMIIQWGTCTSGGDTLEIIGSTNWYHSRADATFPIQFPNACNILIATAVGSKYISCAEGGKTNKGATILLSTPLNSGSSHKVVNWIAIGY